MNEPTINILGVIASIFVLVFAGGLVIWIRELDRKVAQLEARLLERTTFHLDCRFLPFHPLNNLTLVDAVKEIARHLDIEFGFVPGKPDISPHWEAVEKIKKT